MCDCPLEGKFVRDAGILYWNYFCIHEGWEKVRVTGYCKCPLNGTRVEMEGVSYWIYLCPHEGWQKIKVSGSP